MWVDEIQSYNLNYVNKIILVQIQCSTHKQNDLIRGVGVAWLMMRWCSEDHIMWCRGLWTARHCPGFAIIAMSTRNSGDKMFDVMRNVPTWFMVMNNTRSGDGKLRSVDSKYNNLLTERTATTGSRNGGGVSRSTDGECGWIIVRHTTKWRLRRKD